MQDVLERPTINNVWSDYEVLGVGKVWVLRKKRGKDRSLKCFA